MEQTLLLNASYEPLGIVHWQKAITLWYKGRVEILHEHETTVRAVTFSFRLPSVVRLLRFVKIRRSRESIPFTRANIYARDEHRCQYCGEQFPTEDLTFDHVIPQAQGGTKGWENIATACIECNRRKDARTPEEAGMPLLSVPHKPSSTLLLRVSIGIRTMPTEWRSFLYWHAELDQA
jgi:5-methylcytosine-specific restriction endonuclease McrA